MTKLIYDIKPPNRPLKSDLEWVALNPEAQRIVDLRKTVISKDKTQNKIQMLNAVVNVKYED